MYSKLCAGFCVLALATPLFAAEQPVEKSAVPKVRKFDFTYAGVIDKLAPGAKVRVWLPVASDNHEQKVKRVKVVAPAKFEDTVEKKFGNPLMYFEAVASDQGEIPFEVVYAVERRELRDGMSEALREGDEQQFLAGSRLEPADGSLTAKVFGDKRPTGQRRLVAQQLYNAVNGRMKYGKPEGLAWGRGDASWACDNKVGNCTDFHALFISLCRDLKIPAKFEIGFPLPTQLGTGDVAGYHCWAKFAADGKWVAVDISEANKYPELTEYYFGNLTCDRVGFTTGRDLELVPEPAVRPTNFLVYPYVEVDGKPHTSFVKKFRYADVADVK